MRVEQLRIIGGAMKSSREKGVGKLGKTVSFWAFGCLPLTRRFWKVRWKVNITPFFRSFQRKNKEHRNI